MGWVVEFAAPGVVQVVPEDPGSVGSEDVRVQTLFSGISAGTELTAYRGSNPYLTKQWDDEHRLFVPGASTFDFPIRGWGYEEVGVVRERGTNVTDVQVGDVIWGTWGHRSEVVMTGERARQRTLSPDSDPRLGVFSQIGAIALNVVLDADLHVGETVAVFGLGVPGQIACQLARLNGATVVGIDMLSSRRQLARELGVDTVLDPGDEDVAEHVRDLTDGRGADVCLELSGSYRALHEAVRSVAYNSRVCAAGFMQGGGADLRLGEEFHHNRVALICSQISGVSATLQHRWDALRLSSTVMRQAEKGSLKLLELISHDFPVLEASAAFDLLDVSSGDALQVILSFEDPR